MYSQLSESGTSSQHASGARLLKISVAVGSGTFLLVLAIAAVSVSTPALLGTTGAVEPTDLIGLPGVSSLPKAARAPVLPRGPFRGSGPSTAGTITFNKQQMCAALSQPGGQMKDVALAAIRAASTCQAGRDCSVRANPEFQAVMAAADKVTKETVEKVELTVEQQVVAAREHAATLPGVVAPFKSMWDPAGFAGGNIISDIYRYREAELKHGRIAMLATLGFIVGEATNGPFFDDIDLPGVYWLSPALLNGVLPPYQKFWALLFAFAFVVEGFTGRIGEGTWDEPPARAPGDLGYDPLNLKPKDAKKWREVQDKEILNGRLAMIGIIGMVAQECATQEKIFR